MGCGCAKARQREDVVHYDDPDKEQIRKEQERRAKWQQVQDTMRQRSDPLDLAHRRATAQVFREYLATLPSHERNFMLLTLPIVKKPIPDIPYAVSRSRIPDLMETNPEFYKRYRNMVTGENK